MSQPSYHPLEEMLRLIERAAPEPFYPRLFLRDSGADPNQMSALLDYLAIEQLIKKVPGRSLDTGQGVVLTEMGQEVVRDPIMLDRLCRGEALREGDVGAVVRQDMRNRTSPVVTYVLIAINVAIYLYLNPRQNRELFLSLTATSGGILDGKWWLLISSAFLHWDVLHIGSNMFSLYNVGSFVEQAWGKWRYLVIYLIAGWGGGCLGMAYHPANVKLAGASGAVCGVLGAIGAWFLLYRKYIPAEFARNGLWQVGISVGLIALMGMMIPQISNWGHLGGGITGALAAMALHVQRFGVGKMRTPALRWMLGMLLVIAIPVGSYLHMRAALAGPAPPKPVAGGGGDVEEDVRPPKDLPTKPEDAAAAMEFNRNFGKELTKITEDMYDRYDEMPRTPDAIAKNAGRARQASQDLQADRKALVTLKEELEAKTYNDAYVEQARKEAIALAKVALAYADAALEHLEKPTKASQEDVLKRFNKMVDSVNDFAKRLRKMK